MRPNIPAFMPSIGSSQLVADTWGWPVTVPKLIVGVCASTFDTGASGMKYDPLAPESKIYVSLSSKIALFFFFSFVATLFSYLRCHFLEIL